ncbi:MAG: hypothetical protein JJE13_10340 [Thermoleophilia bacterium]|nr:hypothetical protein [Thermoleophilia bacterium]
MAVDSGTGELYGYLPQRLDEDSPGLRASLAGTNGRVLCHWRKVTEGSSSDLPVSAHVLIEDPSMPAVAFPEIEWEVNYDLFWGTSIGPE